MTTRTQRIVRRSFSPLNLRHVEVWTCARLSSSSVNFLVCVSCILHAASPSSAAQTAVKAARETGASEAPLRVFAAAGTAWDAAAPLAVISHGAEARKTGSGCLAEAMSSLGYTAVVMDHGRAGDRPRRGLKEREAVSSRSSISSSKFRMPSRRGFSMSAPASRIRPMAGASRASASCSDTRWKQKR